MEENAGDGPSQALNQYGDKVVRTTGTHGADISSQRLDELDELALRHVLDNKKRGLTAVDIGCGLGSQGLRFGLCGVETTLIDVLDISERINLLTEMFEICNLRFKNADAGDITEADLPDNIGTAYSQRSIHYLQFREAVECLSRVANKMVPDGRLFVSASGLHTELGNTYPHKDRPVEERYSKLDGEMADKHDIRDEICLYTTEDMEKLLTSSGFRPECITRSKFGNVKAVGEKTP